MCHLDVTIYQLCILYIQKKSTKRTEHFMVYQTCSVNACLKKTKLSHAETWSCIDLILTHFKFVQLDGLWRTTTTTTTIIFNVFCCSAKRDKLEQFALN